MFGSAVRWRRSLWFLQKWSEDMEHSFRRANGHQCQHGRGTCATSVSLQGEAQKIYIVWSLSILRGLIPAPPWIPKSADAQTPYLALIQKFYTFKGSTAIAVFVLWLVEQRADYTQRIFRNGRWVTSSIVAGLHFVGMSYRREPGTRKRPIRGKIGFWLRAGVKFSKF